MRCLHVIGAFTSTIALLSSSPALADYEYESMMPVRPLTMSDPAGLTAIALDFQYTRSKLLAIDFQTFTFDLDVDLRVAPHWVLLLRAPFSYAKIDGDPLNMDCCDLALGNLTLGGRGLWSGVLGDDLRAVVGGELSVALPTASDGGDRAASASNSAFDHLSNDPYLYAPNITTIRFNVLSQFYSRYFLVHGEIGPQLYIYDGDVAGDNFDATLRLAAALGFRATYTIAILAELDATLFSSNELGGAIDTATSVDLGLRYASGSALFGLRVYLPLDSGRRDLDMIGVGADLGLRF